MSIFIYMYIIIYIQGTQFTFFTTYQLVPKKSNFHLQIFFHRKL